MLKTTKKIMIKKYKITEGQIDNIPSKVGEDEDFRKYKKPSKSSTWVVLERSSLSMRYLSQINSQNEFFAGFLPEPYLLFLNNSKNQGEAAVELQKEFRIKVTGIFPLSKNFELKILNQDHYNKYLICKINSLVSLIMAIESFMNKSIPDNIQLKLKGKIFSKGDIEKHLSLKEKFTQVLPYFKEVKENKVYQQKYNRILQLNQIRNNLIHLKSGSENGKLDPYLKEFENLLVMKIKKEIQLVESFFELVESYEYKTCANSI